MFAMGELGEVEAIPRHAICASVNSSTLNCTELLDCVPLCRLQLANCTYVVVIAWHVA